MPADIISLLIQIPIVAVFIWYSDRKDKQFQAFLREQRAEYVAALKDLGCRVDAHDTKLEHHDQKTDLALARMEERTRPNKVRKTA